VPSEIVAKTSEDTKEQLQALFTLPEAYTQIDMQLACMEALIDQGKHREAISIIKGNKDQHHHHHGVASEPLEPSEKLDVYIQKLFAIYMGKREKEPLKKSEYSYSRTIELFSSTIKDLYTMFFDKTLKKEAGMRIINYLLSARDQSRSDINFCIDIVHDI
jgi:hypothetical protein